MSTKHALPPAVSRPDFHKGIALGAGSLAALLILTAGLGYWNTLQLRQNDAWVAHTDEVLSALEGVVSKAEEERARSAAEILRQKELLAVTLASIGDGVIVTDSLARVIFLNCEAERLTGWMNCEAEGRPLPAVFHVINEQDRQPVEDPVEKVLRLGTVVGLAMTAHALKGDRQRCLGAGMDNYVAKPIRAEELFQAIDAVFSDRQRAPASEVSLDVVNWTEALKAAQGDRKVLKSMTEAALEEIPRLTAAIRDAIADGDRTKLRLAAHTLKASVRYFGASQICERAAKLEEMPNLS